MHTLMLELAFQGDRTVAVFYMELIVVIGKLHRMPHRNFLPKDRLVARLAYLEAVAKNSPDTIKRILEINRDRDPGGLSLTPIIKIFLL